MASTVSIVRIAVFATLLAAGANARPDNDRLPSGQFISPNVVPGVVTLPLNPHLRDYPDYVAGQAMSSAVSPDRKTLLVLTSGYNALQVPSTYKLDQSASSEYLFVYDISHGAPVERHVLQIPTANAGVAFSPDGTAFFVGSGGGDSVYRYALGQNGWQQDGEPIRLGHMQGVGIGQKASTAGLAVSRDGKRLAVANEYNDSVSLIDAARRIVTGELDLRPGIEDPAKSGVAGGETPFWIVTGPRYAYVSSERDREVDVLDISGSKPAMVARIPVKGTPVKMVLDANGDRLFVACDNDDSVQVIDTARNEVVSRMTLTGALLKRGPRYRGAAPNDLAIAPDGRLLVSLGGENAVAVLDPAHGQTLGLVPTGWYPNAVSVTGGWLYVTNSRSDPGPNTGRCTSSVMHDIGKAAYVTNCRPNQYVLQLEGASLQGSPLPDAAALASLTRQVLSNDGFDKRSDRRDDETMAALRKRIKHVIYVIKENRTYDQVLGDLGRGNGDSAITEFGRKVTPNFHALARQFVDLDNFEDSSEVSGNGWQWDLQGRETDFNVKTVPLQYSPRKSNAPYDSEGSVRNVDVGLGSLANRMRADPQYPNDPNLLPGPNSDDVADGPQDDDGSTTQTGLLWDAVLRAGLSVRNYGVNVTNVGDPADADAYANKDPQAFCHSPALIPYTDIFVRGFDQRQPDFYRWSEWHREFGQYQASGKMPSLELVRFSHDHMGSFGKALAGVNTPELQQADDDYAVGLLVQDVAHSRFRDSTLIFVIEDDAQDGPDHVDAHRSTAYVVGPYVRHGAVVSQRYTTISMLRTIEDVLGIQHLSLFDATQRPMTEVFNLSIKNWNFEAEPSDYLRATTLPLPTRHAALGPVPASSHDAGWWEARTAGYDWSREDRVPAVAFNEVLWSGLMSGRAYPAVRSGAELH